MCKSPFLAMYDFTVRFIAECDALGHGIGVFLMQ